MSSMRTMVRVEEVSQFIAINPVQVKYHLCQFMCEVCERSFSRSQDLNRHKCKHEREKPIEDQKGAVQCRKCKRAEVVAVSTSGS